MKPGEINSLFKNLSKKIKNPKSDLKYKNNFLCGPNCSWEISEKHKEKYVGP